MSTLQRIRAGSVFLHRKGRWLPALYVVARSALAMIRAFGKLTVVGIGFVTIHAHLEDQRLLEIAITVALGAIHGYVLPLQRKLRLGVVKAFVDRRERNLFPAGRAVAGLATLREAVMMRVLVAIRALSEGYSRIPRLVVRTWRMALGARNLPVQAGKGIARLRVIELAGANGLPIFEVVTLLAGLPQSPVVWILVAGDASGRNTEIRPAQVFDSDAGTFLRTDFGRSVAAVAGKASVLALQQVAGLLVVKCFDVPLDQGEIFAVVFGVAAGALLAGPRRQAISRVQSLAGIQPRGDLGVAVQTFERSLSPKLVATGTVDRSVE